MVTMLQLLPLQKIGTKTIKTKEKPDLIWQRKKKFVEAKTTTSLFSKVLLHFAALPSILELLKMKKEHFYPQKN